MKRVIIICEGQTEKEFCNKILSPYFALNDIYIQAPLIKKTKGGIVKWVELKKQITLHLVSEPSVYVTTLIDYYGLYARHKFPSWDIAEKEPDKNLRMDILENGMFSDIEDSIRFRYIPYIQLHEFEGLLFNDINVFYNEIPPNELVGKSELENIFTNYSNPELINNAKDTAPSYRLARIIVGYNKVVYGHILAEAIGIENIIRKCPRFRAWVSKIKDR